MSKKLTIGLFIDQYEPYMSGAMMAVKSLRSEFEKLGHKVYIVAPSVKNYNEEDPHVVRIKAVHNIDIDENHDVALPTRSDVRRLEAYKFDIINAHDVFFTAYLGLAVAKELDVPFVQTYHTLFHRFAEQVKMHWYIYPLSLIMAMMYYPFVFGLRKTAGLFGSIKGDSRRLDIAARFTWQHMVNMGRAADLTIAPSGDFQKEFQQFGGLKKTIVITNGVMPFQAPKKLVLPVKKPGFLRVIYVGRISSEKRIDVLIRALAKSPKTELIVAGQGRDAKSLMSLAETLGVTDRTHFVGLLENNLARQAMRESDVLTVASYNFDSQPVVIDEALDAGIPIIYCDPRFKEGLTPQNSVLVAKDASGFAKGFKKLQNANLLTKMGKASKQLSKNFSSAAKAKQYLDAYESVLKSK